MLRTALIGLALVSCLIGCECQAKVSLESKPSNTVDPKVLEASPWQEVNVGDFSISLPPGWVHEKGAGVDSAVGNFKGDKILLCYDFGMYSWRMSGIKDSVEEDVMVGGKEARLVTGGDKNVAGIYFEDVIEELGFNLVVYGLDLTADQQKLVVQILKTIKFKE